MVSRLACCSKRLSSPSLGSKQPAPYYKNHSRDLPKSTRLKEEICTQSWVSWHIHVAAYNSISCQSLEYETPLEVPTFNFMQNFMTTNNWLACLLKLAFSVSFDFI